MFHTIADFINLWNEEAQNTEKLFSTLTDESLNKPLAPNVRTLGKLAWHILETPKEMLERTGLKIEGPDHHSQPPKTVKALLEELHKVSKSVVHQVQTHWNNKSLHQTDNMYGQPWTRSKTLTALILHQAHHRAQMVVLMRMAGLQVPGIYGPSKEEWTKFGMEPQE